MLIAGWTAVIVNYNGADYLAACLHALQRARVPPYDIIVVDNASADDSLQELHAFPRVDVLAQPHNLGFAGGANVGVAAVETELALVMNPDVEVEPDFGAALIDVFAADDRLGAAGALLLYPDSDRVQHAGGVIERPLMTTSHIGYGQDGSTAFSTPRDVDFVTGAAMGLRITAFRQIGGFDEQFSPVYYEDADLCLRLRDAGWRVRFIPSLRAIHHEGVTLERSAAYYRFIHANRIRFALKHLTGVEWRAQFVPAEIERLRHELYVLKGEEWAARSGADAIEWVTRGVDGRNHEEGMQLLLALSLTALDGRLDRARELAGVPGNPLPEQPRLRDRVNDLRRDDVLRAHVEAALEQQRAFNAAVVQALEAQDRLNREQTAMALLLALDMLGHLHAKRVERAGPPAE